MKTIMTIGAHVGDMELTAGGLVASEAAKGNRTVLVSMTAGEKGNPPGMGVDEYRRRKVEEAEAFASAFSGVSIVLDGVDGLLKEDDENVWTLVDLIRQYRPDVIITHWRNSIHKDHAETSRIAEHARYYAGNAGFERRLRAHACPRMIFAENLEDMAGFSPYLYVDVSSGFEAWKREVSKMWFVTHSTDHRYLDYYDALSTIRGCESGYTRAEAFMVRDVHHHVALSSVLDFGGGR